MKRAPDKLLKALVQVETLAAAKKTSKAIQAARQAYVLACEYLPLLHPERRRAGRLLGGLLLELGHSEEARVFLLEAGELQADGAAEAEMQARNAEVALRLQYGVSEELLFMAGENAEFAKRTLPTDSEGGIEALRLLGRITEEFEDFKTAEKLFAAVLQMRRDQGAADVQLVPALLDLGRLYHKIERLPKSHALYTEALKKMEEQPGEKLAGVLSQYAEVCLDMGHGEEALEHARASVEMFERFLGPDAPEVARALDILAAVHGAAEDTQAEGQARRRAWEIADRSLGSDHPETVTLLARRGVALLVADTDQEAEGLEMLRQADQAARLFPPGEPAREEVKKLLGMVELLL